MKTFLIGLIVGSIMGGIWVTYRITEGFDNTWKNKTFTDVKRETRLYTARELLTDLGKYDIRCVGGVIVTTNNFNGYSCLDGTWVYKKDINPIR